jgi:hypothetical protein
MNSPFRPSRRELLKGTGALIVALSLPELPAQAQDMPAPKTVAPDQVDGFLAIDEKGMVTVYAGKVDLGTGVRTAFAQIAAEELDVPMVRVNVVQGDTALTPDQGPTYGSLSVPNRRSADPPGGRDGAKRASSSGGHAPWGGEGRPCRHRWCGQREIRRIARSLTPI